MFGQAGVSTALNNQRGNRVNADAKAAISPAIADPAIIGALAFNIVDSRRQRMRGI
jgi:hypothetical protein